MRSLHVLTIAACVSFPARANAQASAPAAEKASIVGAWTLNKELSDQDPGRGDGGTTDRGREATADAAGAEDLAAAASAGAVAGAAAAAGWDAAVDSR